MSLVEAPSELVHDRGAVDTEFGGEFSDRETCETTLNQLIDLRVVQTPLELSRPVGSSGYLVTTLTSDDGAQVGHVVLVGVTAQQLHQKFNSRTVDATHHPGCSFVAFVPPGW